MEKINEVFMELLVQLEDRGMKKVKTMVEESNDDQRRLAEFFGFQHTGVTKEIKLDNGITYYMDEMEFDPNGSS